MALRTICNACERRVVATVPEGMIGGAICDCKGECRDGRYARDCSLLDGLVQTAQLEDETG
jgi:hypothetical protein